MTLNLPIWNAEIQKSWDSNVPENPCQEESLCLNGHFPICSKDSKEPSPTSYSLWAHSKTTFVNPPTPRLRCGHARLSPGQRSVGRNEAHHFQARSLGSAHTVTRAIHMSLVPSHPPTGHRGATGKLEALGTPWMEGAVSRIPCGEQGPVPTPEATLFRLWVACLLC